MRRWQCAGFAAVVAGSSVVATAADRPYRAYRDGPLVGYYGHESVDRADAACPKRPPLDYRQRLVGEPGCYAARAYGMSSRLYGAIIQPQWSAEY